MRIELSRQKVHLYPENYQDQLYLTHFYQGIDKELKEFVLPVFSRLALREDEAYGTYVFKNIEEFNEYYGVDAEKSDPDAVAEHLAWLVLVRNKGFI